MAFLGAPHWFTGSSPRRLALGATLQPGGWVSAMGERAAGVLNNGGLQRGWRGIIYT